MPIYRGFGAIAAVIAIAMGVVPATAGADAVTAPQVFVRLVDPDNATVGRDPVAAAQRHAVVDGPV